MSEVLCALDPPTPRAEFREKTNAISDQRKLLCRMLEKFKDCQEGSAKQKALWALFGGEESFSSSVEHLEVMINAVQQKAERLALIDRMRGLNNFRRPTKEMYECGLEGLTLCSQFQCKLLLECGRVWDEVGNMLSLEKGEKYKPIFCNLFKSSLEQINRLKFQTYPLLGDAALELIGDNDALIMQLTGEVRERFPDEKDFGASLDFLDEFLRICESQLSRAVLKIQDVYNNVKGDLEDEFRLFEELISLYNAHHRQQYLVINSLHRFF